MIKQITYLTFLDALLSGDKLLCQSIVRNLIDNKIPVETVYFDLFQKIMYRIGTMWEKNQISIAVEHQATQIIDELISTTLNESNRQDRIGKRCIISCVDKEYHLLGAKMVSYIFELNGWDAIFLGASTPPKTLVKFIVEKDPHVVGLSNNFHLNFLRLLETVELIKQARPHQQIYLGGQAIGQIADKLPKENEGVRIFSSIMDLNKHLKEISLQPV
ncbi:MAG: cobalamin-dependent protein [Ignavibacteriaceae bacterium]|nr:cobalamin-dependent protein [Ignavibacteriaceae bacterium]